MKGENLMRILKEMNWKPIQLQSKEGLALVKWHTIYECLWRLEFDKSTENFLFGRYDF